MSACHISSSLEVPDWNPSINSSKCAHACSVHDSMPACLRNCLTGRRQSYIISLDLVAARMLFNPCGVLPSQDEDVISHILVILPFQQAGLFVHRGADKARNEAVPGQQIGRSGGGQGPGRGAGWRGACAQSCSCAAPVLAPPPAASPRTPPPHTLHTHPQPRTSNTSWLFP